MAAASKYTLGERVRLDLTMAEAVVLFHLLFNNVSGHRDTSAVRFLDSIYEALDECGLPSLSFPLVNDHNTIVYADLTPDEDDRLRQLDR